MNIISIEISCKNMYRMKFCNLKGTKKYVVQESAQKYALYITENTSRNSLYEEKRLIKMYILSKIASRQPSGSKACKCK